jgi:hypothetical protein
VFFLGCGKSARPVVVVVQQWEHTVIVNPVIIVISVVTVVVIPGLFFIWLKPLCYLIFYYPGLRKTGSGPTGFINDGARPLLATAPLGTSPGMSPYAPFLLPLHA